MIDFDVLSEFIPKRRLWNQHHHLIPKKVCILFLLKGMRLIIVLAILNQHHRTPLPGKIIGVTLSKIISR